MTLEIQHRVSDRLLLVLGKWCHRRPSDQVFPSGGVVQGLNLDHGMKDKSLSLGEGCTG